MSRVRLAGSDGEISIDRDSFGIPHVRAQSAADAWYGLGYAAAADRLWQMEYDRRRAEGRWAEAVGTSGVGADVLARRLRLAEAAQADVAAMSEATEAGFRRYAEGINAWLASGFELPPEFALSGITPEPWRPWHSVAGFKVRHVLMGAWQTKLIQAAVLARSGPAALGRVLARTDPGSPVTVPPGRRLSGLYASAALDLEGAARELGFLAEEEAGSNAWVVAGSRTTSGHPVLCNDSHRALDCPNVYWQARLSCPEFEVAGATLPGLPGFPHFGHNGRVAWAITHGSADTQDLYIERFTGEPGGGLRCQTAQGPVPAGHRIETIEVRGAAAVRLETWSTPNGPVVHGDPRRGTALSLRWTATERAGGGFEVLAAMLPARGVRELFEAQRGWVDPVQNLLAADVEGTIGYLLRGELPIRASTAARHLPAAGWTGENRWTGRVAFEAMPRVINPEAGYVVTSNQAVLETDQPYISSCFSDPVRAERLTRLLGVKERLSAAELTLMQADVTSLRALEWVARLRLLGPLAGPAEQARAAIVTTEGRLELEGGGALVYACFVRELARGLLEPVLGTSTWNWLLRSGLLPVGKLVRRWAAALVAAGAATDEVATAALDRAWTAASSLAGPDPTTWQYGDHHRAAPRHSLAAGFAASGTEGWSPRPVAMGGDSDTVQAAAYSMDPAAPLTVTNLPVYRQVVEMTVPPRARWVIPGGASGWPGHDHFEDQLGLWAGHRLIPID